MLIPDVTVGRADVAIKEQPGFQPCEVQLVVEIESRSSVTMDRDTKPSWTVTPTGWSVRRSVPLRRSWSSRPVRFWPADLLAPR